jgi:hypothetical protein
MPIDARAGFEPLADRIAAEKNQLLPDVSELTSDTPKKKALKTNGFQGFHSAPERTRTSSNQG